MPSSSDEQSEDGELRQSPETCRQKDDTMDFSLSEDEGENVDSLDIKPPQARASTKSGGSGSNKRYEQRTSSSSVHHHHKRSEMRHATTTTKGERHSHREKHHRDLQQQQKRASMKERERYYRDKQLQSNYEQQNNYDSYVHNNRERPSSRHHNNATTVINTNKYEEKKNKDKYNRKYDEEKRDRADKTLQDLRERLLSKRTTGNSSKSDEDYYHNSYNVENKNRKLYRVGHHHHHHHHTQEDNNETTLDSVLQGEAGMYVKEIINISTTNDDGNDFVEMNKNKHNIKADSNDTLTEEERAQQELRKEKLLEAEREMARVKELSKQERERRHLIEKTSKSRGSKYDEGDDDDDDDNFYNKRMKLDDLNVVTVSDNSEDDEAGNHYERDVVMADEDDGKSDYSSRSDRSDEKSSDSRDGRSPPTPLSSSDTTNSTNSPKSKNNVGRDSSQDGTHRHQDHPLTESSSAGDNKNNVDGGGNEEVGNSKNVIDDGLPPYYPAVQGCRSVEEFQCLNRIEEGTYGVVYRAKDKRTEDIVALKRLKMEKEKEGFPITSLREINTLLKGQHPNIVTVREIVVGSNMDKIFIVMDYVEHDLKSLMETMRTKKQNFVPGEVKCLLQQLLLAVAHLHDNWILHRDLKTSNLLLSHKGILKVGDFGLAREYGSPLKAYTPIVVTLWYRAPELLLCTKEYSTPIDMWSVGCIFAELLLMNALFPGKSEVDQLNRVFKDLGTPSEKIWPGFNKLPAVQKMKFSDYPISNLRAKFHMLSDLGLNLLTKFLTFDPVQRITAEEAIKHSCFNEAPLPIDPAMFPTWPAKSELGQKRALAASPKPPSGGGEYKKLGGDGDDDGYGFRIGMGVDTRRMGAGFSLKF